LDVHAPHHPIGGWKDFFVHLITISVGLLIAVGIEGCVELHREHKLVREARETMREEIQHNSDKMKEAVVTLDKQTETMKKNIATLSHIQENPKDKAAQDAQIDANFSIIGLRDTAWKTAQATGALSFMPYAEAQRYSDVYGTQKDFLDQQNKVLEDESQFFGVMAKTNFGHNGIITQEQANLALERFGIWQAHLAYVDLMARATAETDAAFLVGKEGPHEMHLELGGGK
jgi:TolA-binding protein